MGSGGAWRYSDPVTSFYRWQCLVLCICFCSLSSWHGTSVTAGIWLLCSLLSSQCPIQYPFHFAEQMKNQGRGLRKDLPKIVRPAIGKIWSRNFIFWLQIVWLFCNKNKIDFYLRFFIIWGGLNLYKRSESYTVYMYWKVIQSIIMVKNHLLIGYADT